MVEQHTAAVVFIISFLAYLTATSALDIRSNDTYEYRLVNGSTPYEGRFEISRNGGPWGTVRGFGMSSKQASLACRSLGFSSSVLSPDLTLKFGAGTGPVHLRVKACSGIVRSILDCTHLSWDDPRYVADHRGDMGLHCLPVNQTFKLRLSGGINNDSGLVEVYDGVSKWGGICGISWRFQAADVVCRQLGFSSALTAFTERLPQGMDMFIAKVRCSYGQPLLDHCLLQAWHHRFCISNTAAGAVCSDTGIGNRYLLRLWGTHHNNSGILQLKKENEFLWRTLCFPIVSQIYVQPSAIAYTFCRNFTGNGDFAAYKTLDSCTMARLFPNVSEVVLVGHMEAFYEESIDHDLIEIRSGSVADGTCPPDFRGLYLTCSQIARYKGVAFHMSQENTCRGQCGYLPLSVSCRCDPECELFHDCCWDYLDVCQGATSPEILNPDMFSCISSDEFINYIGPVMLVSKCPADWSYELIRERCEYLYQFANPEEHAFEHFPVYDEFGNNYKNIYCAICNGKHFVNLQPWNATYNSHSKMDTQQSHGKECGVHQQESKYVGKRLRFCFPSMISNCPPHYTNASVSAICESYSGHFCTSHFLYKNPHCAFCNGVGIDDRAICKRSEQFGSGGILQTLWKFQTSARNVFVQHDGLNCTPGFLYNNRSSCVISPGFTNAIDRMCCKYQRLWMFYAVRVPTSRNSTSVDSEIKRACLLNQLNISQDEYESKWKMNSKFAYSYTKVLLQSDGLTCNRAGDFDTVFLKSDHAFRLCTLLQIRYLYLCEKFTVQNACDGIWLQGKATDFISVNVTNLAEVYLHKTIYIIPKMIMHEIYYKYDHEKRAFEKEEIVLVCGKHIHLRMISCSLITLIKGEYNVSQTENSTQIIVFGKLTLGEKEYIMYPDGRVQICANYKTKSIKDYSGYLEFVNILGNSLSLLGITVVFGLHCVFSELRNFHGCCIMNFCVALFFAQILPVLSANISVTETLCVAFAVVSHYAWLAAFSWMTIISVNLFYVFSFKPLQSRQNRETGIVYRYISPAFGWFVPLVIVVICLCLQYFDFDDTSFRYGGSTPCWIYDPTDNLLAFGLPVGILLANNAILYVITVIVACLNQRRSKRLRRREESLHMTTRDVLLCLKMANLMGITWIFGFIASFGNKSALWWIFIVLNSLHGFSLAVVTLFRTQVQDNIRGRSRQIQEANT